MLSLIAERRSTIAEICRRHHVRRLDAFGSSVRGADFDHDRSDVDFLVEFEAGRAAPSLAEFFALRQALTTTLARPVDLVVRSAVRNPYLLREIDRSKEPVYAA